MKKTLQFTAVALLTVALSTIALAKSHGSPGGNGGASGLEKSMKQMEYTVDAISATITDPSMNAINAQIADNFVQTATKAKTQIPGDIKRLPEPDRSKRIALYEEMMDHAIELGGFLSTALKQNDQAKAQHFLEQINTIETDGHKEFKGNDINYTLQANPQTQAAADLKTAMKNMGINLKLIKAQMTDATKNQDSVRLADDFVANARDSKTFVPVSVSKLPPDQQQARLDLYNQMLDKCIDLGTKLSQAFATGDNATAQTLYNNLLANKKDGHFEFN